MNTLYVTSEDVFLGIEGENIIVKKDEKTLMRVPIHNVEAVVTFNYVGASPALMKNAVKEELI